MSCMWVRYQLRKGLFVSMSKLDGNIVLLKTEGNRQLWYFSDRPNVIYVREGCRWSMLIPEQIDYRLEHELEKRAKEYEQRN